ncbi:hypothetical protein ABE61_23375 [Lysinibacillus sphaericus]|nr:hypothetical protein [Lysinibacillus sphaericus]
MISHRNVVRLVRDTDYIELNENTVILQTGSLSFDASTLEIWGAFLNGGKVVITSQEIITDHVQLKQAIRNNKVTTMWLTSTLFNQTISEDVTVFDTLRHLLIGGEKLSDAHVRMMKEHNKETILTNGYGPTENTTFTTTYEIPENFENIPIGKPVSNTQVYILNGDNLCGIGVPGELCIVGDGLARGYLNRPELTEEKFVKNPFGEGRMYRSGDLARWLPDGNIEYLGRIDEQVKIRGFRIELGEIESRIREIEGIHDSAVIVKADQNGDKAIYAYYTGQGVSVSEIRCMLRERLPEYMTPSYMMEIDSIPVTRNGKLDKRALPEIEVKATREYVAPRNKKESMVCEAFSTMLNVKEVGVKDNFFALGGDSIKAIRIISSLRKVGYHLTVKDILTGKTTERIALVMEETGNERKYEQGEVSGPVTKTPIIKLFDFWNLEKPEHFNQAMMFSVDGIDNAQIKQAIEELVKHHDMLRAVYKNQQLEILPISERELCDFYEFDYRGKDDVKQGIQERCSKIQASINLEIGPLVKIAVFETDHDKVMMFCVHHLVIDGVSWRILAEDFETAVGQIKKGEEVKLPEKTASFKEWAESLERYAMSPELKNDRMYWQDVIANLQVDKRLENESDEKYISDSVLFSLNKEETYQLLRNVNNAYNTKIDDILLCALVRAMNQWNGEQKVSVSIEGHGREETPYKLDIDRTVGWFTDIYPVIFEHYEDLGNSIILTKETLRDVPNKGLTFGLIDNAQTCQTDVTFNYLGQVVENTELDYSKYSAGMMMAAENHTNANLTFNGILNNDEITFGIYFNKCLFEKNAIKNLGNKYIEMLQEIIKHCIHSVDSVLTISDLDTNDLDDDDMSIINDLFEFV